MMEAGRRGCQEKNWMGCADSRSQGGQRVGACSGSLHREGFGGSGSHFATPLLECLHGSSIDTDGGQRSLLVAESGGWFDLSRTQGGNQNSGDRGGEQHQ